MSISQEKCIETYLQNNTLTNNIKNIIIEVLKKNKDIVQDYLNEEPLYYIYVRNEDSYLDHEKKKHHCIYLMAAFTKLDDAKYWILQNGKECIDSWNHSSSNGPYILTIIDKIHSNDNYDSDDAFANIYFISTKQYISYAFTKEGYKMLLNEHNYISESDWCNDIFPYWIYYIDDNGNITRGSSKKHMDKLISNYRKEYIEEAKVNAYKQYNKYKKTNIID